MTILKTSSLLLLCLLLFCFSASAQWTPSTNSALCHNIQMVSPTTAYMAGELLDVGFIYKTTDGGASLTTLIEADNTFYRGIHFFDTNKGFVVGSEDGEAVILKTTNGGQSWTRQNLPELALNGVYFINEQVGFVYTSSGVTIYKTTDGGTTWQEVSATGASEAINMQFITPQIGFLATTDGVLKTTNAGATWQLLNQPGNVFVNNIHFLNEFVGFATMSRFEFPLVSEYIYRTSDGGVTWDKIYTTAAESTLNGLKFLSPLVAVVLEQTADNKLRLLKTTNGGNTWSVDCTQNLSPNDFISSLTDWDFSGNTAIAVGRTQMMRNTNFTANLNLTQPTVLLTSSLLACPNIPVQLRFDFTGNPPYSFNLNNNNGGSTPLSNITTNPYFRNVNVSVPTTYTVSNFSANGISGQSGGSAALATNAGTSARLSGGSDVCYGTNTRNIRLVLRGCPPFTVKLKNGLGSDTATLVFQTAGTVEVAFEPILPAPTMRRECAYTLQSVTDGNGQTVQDLSGYAYFYVLPKPNFYVSANYPTEICPDKLIPLNVDINIFAYGPGVPFTLTLHANNTVDTIDYQSGPIIPLRLRQTSAPFFKFTTVCGDSIFRLDTITVLPNLPIPTGFKATNTRHTGVELTWDSLTIFAEAILERKTDSTDWRGITRNFYPDQHRYFDYTASQGINWYYRIWSYNLVGCPSLYSPVDTIKLDAFFDKKTVLYANPTGTNAVYSNMTVRWANVNTDTLPDIFTIEGSVRNQGYSNFTFQKWANNVVMPRASNMADVDNDGDMDLVGVLITNQIILYINRGNNVFDPQILPNVSLTASYNIFFIDYNNDGWIDLLCRGAQSDGETRIFLNNRNNTFTLFANHPFQTQNSRVFLADVDNDNDLDAALLARDWIFFYRCNAFNTYTLVDSVYFVTGRPRATDVSWWDVDTDGDLDLLIPFSTSNWLSPIACIKNNNGHWELTYLHNQENSPAGTFCGGDFNNDGWVDFIIGDDVLLHKRVEDGYDLYANAIVGKNSAKSLADVDRDGDLDVATSNTVNSLSSSAIDIYDNLLNRTARNTNWVEINLEGRISNRSALGAIIRVKAKINNVPRWQMRCISSDDSRADRVAHFGLGNATLIDSIIVQWTSGKKTILTNQPINKYRHIIEDTTTNPACIRTNVPIIPINNVVRLCNQTGVIKLTTNKIAGESISWYRGANNGRAELMGTTDTLLLNSDKQTGDYTVTLRDTLRGCAMMTSAQSQTVTISNPTPLLVIDSLACGNKRASIILSDSLNNANLYTYFLEKYYPTTSSWSFSGFFNPNPYPYQFGDVALYRMSSFANNDTSCKAVSRNINIRGSLYNLTLSGKVSLRTVNTPSVNSLVWLYRDRILVDSTRTNANGVYSFNVSTSAVSYQVKAASSGAGYKTTFFGGVESLASASSLVFSDCENRIGNIALIRFSPTKTDLPYAFVPRSGFTDTTVIVKLIGASDSISQAKNAGKTLNNNTIRLKIFPNPFSEKCTIEVTLMNEGLLKMTLFNNFGQVVIAEKTQYKDKGTYVLPIENAENLAAGIYIVQLSLNNEQVFFKIVKMN